MDDHSKGAVSAVPNDPAALPDMTELAERLVTAARSRRAEPAGENGLPTRPTRRVLQSALEMSRRLGDDKHDPVRRSA